MHTDLPPLPPGENAVEHVLNHFKRVSEGDGFGTDIHWVNSCKEMIREHYSFEPYPHCHVPGIEETVIQRWAKTQRKGGLQAWKRRILDCLGFTWDVFEYNFDMNLLRLQQFKEKWGHYHVPTNYEDQHLFLFVKHLRDKRFPVSEGHLKKLRDIGYTLDMGSREWMTEWKQSEEDKEMVKRLRQFWEESSDNPKNRHTNVPFPQSTQDRRWFSLYYWFCSAKERYVHTVQGDGKDVGGFKPLCDEVLIEMAKLEVVLDPVAHFGLCRVEHRYYVKLVEVYDRLIVERGWKDLPFRYDKRDKPAVKDLFLPDGTQRQARHQRRPDAHKIIQKEGGVPIAIVDEYDERRHDDRTIESEQRKVYHWVNELLKQRVRDIHLIRVNGADRYYPDENQLIRHAELLHEIRNAPVPDKPTVTVYLLDWDKNHHHVKAYQARKIPEGSGIGRAKEEKFWDTLPLYDRVIMEFTKGVTAGS